MKTKKIPQRQCVICRESKPKKDLIRIVRNKEEGVLIDPTGKKNGRGAYICKDIKCISKAKKTHKLENTLKTKIPEDIYQEIESYVKE
ncbi:MAG: YlxR family protein [Tissierellia bacterium]|nr:YlxR family protein [Tissierellia bacterium]